MILCYLIDTFHSQKPEDVSDFEGCVYEKQQQHIKNSKERTDLLVTRNLDIESYYFLENLLESIGDIQNSIKNLSYQNTVITRQIKCKFFVF